MTKEYFEAAKTGQYKILKNYIEQKRNINILDENKRSLLYWTINGNYIECAKLLIENGIDVNLADQDKWTPLFIAVGFGFTQCVELLLQNNANVNYTDEVQWTPLHLAAHRGYTDSLRLLLRRGAKTECYNKYHFTPIHIAAQKGHLECIATLLEFGANPKSQNIVGNTPLHEAAIKGYIDSVKKLIEKGQADYTIKNEKDETALDVAIINNKLSVVQYLVEKDNFNVLLNDEKIKSVILTKKANLKNYFELIQVLYLKKRTKEEKGKIISDCFKVNDIELSCITVETLLFFKEIEFLNLHQDSLEKLFQADLSIKLRLVNRIIYNWNKVSDIYERYITTLDIYNLDGHNQSLLHFVVLNHCPNLIEPTIVKRNCLINGVDKDGNTALHTAAAIGDLQCVDELLRLGAKCNGNNNQQTAVHLTAKSDNKEILESLVKKFGKEILVAKDKFANNLLHYCGEFNAKKIFNYLTTFYAQLLGIDEVNEKGQTPLHRAAERGNFSILQKIYCQHSDIDAIDNDGNTPLHIAVLKKQLEIVQALLTWKANPDILNNSRLTAAALAKSEGFQSIVNRINNTIDYETQPVTTGHTDTDDEITDVFLQGGGVKGIGFYGALKVLLDEKVIKLNKLRRVAGTSAGSITALLLSLGYDLEELDYELNKLDFGNLLGGSYQELLFALKNGRYNEVAGKDLYSMVNSMINEGALVSLAKLFNGTAKEALIQGLKMLDKAKEIKTKLEKDFGLFDGEKLRLQFVKWINTKVGDENFTFAELREKARVDKKYKELYVIGYNLSKQRAEIFSAEHTPNAIIADAVRLSMAIPILFEPHQCYEKIDGKRVLHSDKHKFVDGAVTDNHRIKIFDNTRYIDSRPVSPYIRLKADRGQPQYNRHVIGLRLVSSELRKHYEKGIPLPTHEINDFLSYVWLTIKGIIEKQESDYHNDEYERDRTLHIDVFDVGTADFDLSETDKNVLIQSGKDAAHDFIKRRQDLPKPYKIDNEFLSILIKYAKNFNLQQLIVQSMRLKKSPQLIYKLVKKDKDKALEIIKDFKLSILVRDEQANTAFHLAAKKGDIEVLKRLDSIKNCSTLNNSDKQKIIENVKLCQDKSAKDQIIKYLTSKGILVDLNTYSPNIYVERETNPRVSPLKHPLTAELITKNTPIFNKQEVDTGKAFVQLRKGLKNEVSFYSLLFNQNPYNLLLGQARDNGDCFFDSLAQILNKINDTDVNTVKYLRMLCHGFYQKYKELVDGWNVKDYGGLDKRKDEYYMVQYTYEECKQDFNDRSPIWGRPGIEGVILCKELQLAGILVIEILENPETKLPILSYHLAITTEYKSISEEAAQQYLNNPKIPTLVVEQNSLHFVPLFRNNLEDTHEQQIVREKPQDISNSYIFTFSKR